MTERRTHLSRRSRTAAALLALALLMGACTSKADKGPGTPSGQPPPTHRAVQFGTVSETTPPDPCIAGSSHCTGYQVDCPGVQQPGRGTLAIGEPTGTVRGMLVFFSGGGGAQYWEVEAENDLKLSGGSHGGRNKQINEQAARQAAQFLQGLQAKGYETVMVSWHRAWLGAAPGEQVGPVVLACRGASLIRWIHDTMYDKLGVTPSGLACGFCLTGNSAGSSLLAYSLGSYGLDKIVSAAVLSGGPPHATFWKACLQVSGYTFEPGALGLLDSSYGFGPKQGPCYQGDASWKPRWEADGVDAPDSNHDFPNTRILLLLGSADTSGVGAHQQDYLKVLQEAGSPHVEQRTVPQMTHAITASAEGLQLIQSWFLGS